MSEINKEIKIGDRFFVKRNVIDLLGIDNVKVNICNELGKHVPIINYGYNVRFDRTYEIIGVLPYVEVMELLPTFTNVLDQAVYVSQNPFNNVLSYGIHSTNASQEYFGTTSGPVSSVNYWDADRWIILDPL
jgi:hypothetical protein